MNTIHPQALAYPINIEDRHLIEEWINRFDGTASLPQTDRENLVKKVRKEIEKVINEGLLQLKLEPETTRVSVPLGFIPIGNSAKLADNPLIKLISSIFEKFYVKTSPQVKWWDHRGNEKDTSYRLAFLPYEFARKHPSNQVLNYILFELSCRGGDRKKFEKTFSLYSLLDDLAPIKLVPPVALKHNTIVESFLDQMETGSNRCDVALKFNNGLLIKTHRSLLEVSAAKEFFIKLFEKEEPVRRYSIDGNVPLSEQGIKGLLKCFYTESSEHLKDFDLNTLLEMKKLAHSWEAEKISNYFDYFLDPAVCTVASKECSFDFLIKVMTYCHTFKWSALRTVCERGIIEKLVHHQGFTIHDYSKILACASATESLYLLQGCCLIALQNDLFIEAFRTGITINNYLPLKEIAEKCSYTKISRYLDSFKLSQAKLRGVVDRVQEDLVNSPEFIEKLKRSEEEVLLKKKEVEKKAEIHQLEEKEAQGPYLRIMADVQQDYFPVSEKKKVN